MTENDFITIGNKRYSSDDLGSHLELEIQTLNKRIDYFKKAPNQDLEILNKFEEMIRDRKQILDWINLEHSDQE